MSNPLLSLVMPVFNIAPYLEASILSVLNGAFEDFELIIVNDASTDDSAEVARFFESIDPRVRCVDLPHNTIGGAGVPSNIGIEQARGTYLGFIDGDDFFTGHGLSEMMAQVRQQEADVCIANFRTFRDDTKAVSAPYDAKVWDQLPKERPIDPRATPLVLRLSPVPWRKIYRRAFLDAHAIRFPEVDFFFEDNPLHWSVLCRAPTVVLVDTIVSYHRMVRPGQTMSSQTIRFSAYLHHMTMMARTVRDTGADFAWRELMHLIFTMDWIAWTQDDPVLEGQFRSRFMQIMHDHVLPYVEDQPLHERTRILDLHQAHAKTPEVTFVVHAPEQGDPLDATLRSIREVTAEAEVLLLGPTGCAPPDAEGDVVPIPAPGPETRAFNMAIPLCAGRKVAFLRAGDLASAAAIDAALRRPEAAPADILHSATDSQRPPWTARASLYDRRFLQERATCFGPGDIGHFSFNILSEIAAQTTETSGQALIDRRAPEAGPTEAGQVLREASTLLDRLRHLDCAPEERRRGLDRVATFTAACDALAAPQTVDDLDPAKRHLSAQIAQAHAQADQG